MTTAELVPLTFIGDQDAILQLDARLKSLGANPRTAESAALDGDVTLYLTTAKAAFEAIAALAPLVIILYQQHKLHSVEIKNVQASSVEDAKKRLEEAAQKPASPRP